MRPRRTMEVLENSHKSTRESNAAKTDRWVPGSPPFLHICELLAQCESRGPALCPQPPVPLLLPDLKMIHLYLAIPPVSEISARSIG
jgi:hypothetical protein